MFEQRNQWRPREQHSSSTARVYVYVWPRVLLIVPCYEAYDLARFCIPYVARFCTSLRVWVRIEKYRALLGDAKFVTFKVGVPGKSEDVE